MKKVISCALIGALLSACATAPTGQNYRPITDLKDRDVAKYETDLGDCQRYAAQAAGAAEQAAKGAAAGAIFGALLMAAAGGGQRNRGALVGGLSGAAGGAVEGERDQRKIIVTCLVGRGYSVLS